MPRFGTVPSMLFVAWSLVAIQGASAATKEPPYEAVVESDEAFVRCGPGKSFYPTGKLQHGDHVTVRRHDPGGWFMIDPPPGSFSLVPGDDVQREGNVGTVKPLAEGQTPVRIGSAIDPTIDSVYQRQLSSGERVEILGEATLLHRNAQVQMLKIRSPKGEFRWIEGMNLTPLEQQRQDQQIRAGQVRNSRTLDQPDSDPFAAPPQSAKNSAPSVGPTVSSKPAAKLISSSRATTVTRTPATPDLSPQQNGPATGAQPGATSTLVDPHARLDQIDLEFRDTIQRQPATWNLPQIEQAYRELSRQSISTAMRGQLDLRFSAVEHYKQVKAEYVDYLRLVSNTARKDAELAAIQNSLDPQDARPPIAPSGEMSPATQVPTTVPTTVPTDAAEGPRIPLPSPSVPESQVSPGVPEFNPPVQQPAPPQSNQHAVGPVLETPVPLPTEPVPDTSQKREMRQEMPIVPQPPVAPGPSGIPSQELQPNPNAAPTVSAPRIGATEVRSAPAPANDGFTQSAPAAPQPLVNPDLAPPRQQQQSQPQAQPQMQPAGPSPMSPSPPVSQMPNSPMVPALAAPRQIRPQAAGGLDGAGIVQQAATPIPGGPRHVLLAPNGRILAYLYPDRGINLDAYVGRSMGILGPRAYRPDYRADVIVVRGMVPVRLLP